MGWGLVHWGAAVLKQCSLDHTIHLNATPRPEKSVRVGIFSSIQHSQSAKSAVNRYSQAKRNLLFYSQWGKLQSSIILMDCERKTMDCSQKWAKIDCSPSFSAAVNHFLTARRKNADREKNSFFLVFIHLDCFMDCERLFSVL